jgi:hypothetical protein
MTQLTLPPSIANERMNDSNSVWWLALIPSSAFPACPQAFPPGRVLHVRGLSRTWVEHELFPMLSPPVYTYLQEKKEEGFPPDFLWSLVALAHLMRLSLLKDAHAAVGECHVAGNPGCPSCLTHARESPRTWGTRPGGKACEEARDLSPNQRSTLTSLGPPNRLFIRGAQP